MTEREQNTLSRRDRWQQLNTLNSLRNNIEHRISFHRVVDNPLSLALRSPPSARPTGFPTLSVGLGSSRLRPTGGAMSGESWRTVYPCHHNGPSASDSHKSTLPVSGRCCLYKANTSTRGVFSQLETSLAWHHYPAPEYNSTAGTRKWRVSSTGFHSPHFIQSVSSTK